MAESEVHTQMSAFHSYTANSEALRLAHEIVSDPETRAKIKAALEEEGKPGMSALIDEAVLVARELIRLAELQRDGPNDAQDAARYRWLRDVAHEVEDAPLMLDINGLYFQEDPTAASIDAAIDATMKRILATGMPSKEEA